MKKKIISKLISSIILAFSLASLSVNSAFAATTLQQIDSAITEKNVTQMLKNGEGNKIVEIITQIEQKDNNLNINFNTSSIKEKYHLPKLEEGWSYFVVLIDSANKGPIKSEYLNKKSDGSYSCSIDTPYYCDVVDLHFYKQKNTDPEYYINAENFIGRTKVAMNSLSNFMRGERKEINFTDKDGNVSNPTKRNFITRLAPNYYSIETDEIDGSLYSIAKIVLPQGQGEKLSLDDLTVQSVEFVPGATPQGEETWNGAVYPKGRFYNFYLPDDVTNFKFQIFKNQVSDNKADVIKETDIDLKRL